MALRKQLLLPVAALLFSGVIAANAGSSADLADVSEDKRTDDIVAAELAEGEGALRDLLGGEVTMLDKLLKSMIHEMAVTYGVSEEELANVAKEAMNRIATMDADTLQATLGQLAGLGGLNLGSQEALQELLGKLDGAGSSGDGI